MPGLVAGTGSKAVNKTNKIPALTVLYVLGKIEVILTHIMKCSQMGRIRFKIREYINNKRKSKPFKY